MAKTALAKLQQIQNEALRTVTAAARPTSCDALRHWLGVRSVAGQQKLQSAREFLRAATSVNHPLRAALEVREDTVVERRLKTVDMWLRNARETVEDMCPVENVKEIRWVPAGKEIITTERVGDRSWRDRDGVVNHTEVSEWLEEKKPSAIVATDGSIRHDVTA